MPTRPDDGPTDTPLLSSRQSPWDSLLLETHRLAPAEREPPPRDRHLLCFNIGGPMPLWLRQGGRWREVSSGTGTLILAPAGQSERARSDVEAHVLHLHLAPDALARVAPEMGRGGRAEIVRALGVRDAQAQHLGLALLAEVEAGLPGGRLYGEALTTALAVHLLARYGAQAPRAPRGTGGLPPARLRRVLAHIHDRLDQDLSLAELAAVAGLSAAHFGQQFRLATGHSPHQYVIRRRVERAKRLLQAGRLSPGQVAQEVGFSHQSHLTRHFRRLVGTTPKKFAES